MGAAFAKLSMKRAKNFRINETSHEATTVAGEYLRRDH
jgi:hypothetical protein